MKALITGASSGIGLDMARLLADQGWELFLVARRKDKLNAVKKELQGVKVTCLVADLSKKKECLDLYSNVQDEEINFLICNAGFGLYGAFIDTELGRELDMISTNITAVHILTKLFLRDFVKRDSGRVLITASMGGFFPGPMMATYYATKNYVVSLAAGIHEELRRRHSKVKISVLCPGPVQTEFSDVADVRFTLKPMTSKAVAHVAIHDALRGKLYVIPGLAQQATVAARHLLSNKMLARLVWYIQQQGKN